MKNAPRFIAAFLAITVTGCVKQGNKKPLTPAPVVAKPAPTPAPAPPPPPLSTPQTQVELPKPQFLDPAALAPETAPPQEEPVEPQPVTKPAGGRRPTGAGTGTQTAPPTAPAATPPAAPPPTTTPPPAEQPTQQIQEIVPPQEAKRLQEQAQAKRRDVQQMLDQLGRRQLTTAQKAVITNINSLLASSVDAERRGDMKTADALAANAQIIAKDLLNGK
jgi:hypothetical protein